MGKPTRENICLYVDSGIFVIPRGACSSFFCHGYSLLDVTDFSPHCYHRERKSTQVPAQSCISACGHAVAQETRNAESLGQAALGGRVRGWRVNAQVYTKPCACSGKWQAFLCLPGEGSECPLTISAAISSINQAPGLRAPIPHLVRRNGHRSPLLILGTRWNHPQAGLHRVPEKRKSCFLQVRRTVLCPLLTSWRLQQFCARRMLSALRTALVRAL